MRFVAKDCSNASVAGGMVVLVLKVAGMVCRFIDLHFFVTTGLDLGSACCVSSSEQGGLEARCSIAPFLSQS